MKDGLDAINKWKEEVLALSTWLGDLCKTGRLIMCTLIAYKK